MHYFGPVPPNLVLVNLTLIIQRLLDGCFSGLGCHRIYHGVLRGIPTDGVLGAALLPPLPSTVSAGYMIDGDAFGRHTHAHEIGHNLGLDHAAFCGATMDTPNPSLPYETAPIGCCGLTVPTLGPLGLGDVAQTQWSSPILSAQRVLVPCSSS